MSPWAGLKRRHILETCRSSLMSNLPHQKTFIPINKALGEGALHRLSAALTAHQCVGSGGTSWWGSLIGEGDIAKIFFSTLDVCICILHESLQVQVCMAQLAVVFFLVFLFVF